MDERDMFYNSYGYGGMGPMGGMPASGMMPGMSSGMMPGMSSGMVGMPSSGATPMTSGMSNGMMSNSYATSQFQDMNDRVNRLERQVKRLDQRLTRLETPYANTNAMLNNEPDNNMYMM